MRLSTYASIAAFKANLPPTPPTLPQWVFLPMAIATGASREQRGKARRLALTAAGLPHSRALTLPHHVGGSAAARAAGVSGVTWKTALCNNLIPVTLANVFAGVVCVSAVYSLAFGALGKRVNAQFGRA